MATRGFEFSHSLNGSTPLIKDLIIGVAAAHQKGDLVLLQADGFFDQVVGSIGEITGVIQETVAAADISAGTTLAKVAIVESGQVWRCSTDAATAATALAGTIKTMDTVDANTIDADDVSNGSMIVYELPSILDDDGNVIAYVLFADTTFGNA
jgi:hypothetical protein